MELSIRPPGHAVRPTHSSSQALAPPYVDSRIGDDGTMTGDGTFFIYGHATYFHLAITPRGAQDPDFVEVVRDEEGSQGRGTCCLPTRLLLNKASVRLVRVARGRKATLCITVAGNPICPAKE